MSKDWRHKKDHRYEEHRQQPKLKPNTNGFRKPRDFDDVDKGEVVEGDLDEQD